MAVAAGVWFDWAVMVTVGTYPVLLRFVGPRLGNLKKKRRVETKSQKWCLLSSSYIGSCCSSDILSDYNNYFCLCLPNPGFTSNIFVLMSPQISKLNSTQYIGAHAYLVIKLAGGRGSAEAAAAVTKLPIRLVNCQLGLR